MALAGRQRKWEQGCRNGRGSCIEVRLGDYLDEDDIVRIEDDYDRD